MLAPKTSELLLPLVMGVALAAGGCSSNAKARGVRAADAKAAREAAGDAEYPLIVRLEGRHYTVSASSGPDGVVYSAASRDGRQVVANASLDELRQRHPDIYQQIIPGIAEKGEGSESSRRTATDAAGEADASIGGPVPPGTRTLLMTADRP